MDLVSFEGAEPPSPGLAASLIPTHWLAATEAVHDTV